MPSSCDSLAESAVSNLAQVLPKNQEENKVNSMKKDIKHCIH